MTGQTLAESVEGYRNAIGSVLELDPSVFAEPGVTVAPAADRAGSRLVAAYRIGDHVLLWCDPGVADAIGSLASPESTTLDAFARDVANLAQGDVVGRGFVHLVGSDTFRPQEPPSGVERRELDRGAPGDLVLIEALIEASTEDDLDMAEIELSDLDEHVTVYLDDTGAIGAYASDRPWEFGATYGDIGVLTVPAHRGSGWAAGLVSSHVDRIFRRGDQPMYRCDWDNVGSKRVAERLGFVEVAELSVARLP